VSERRAWLIGGVVGAVVVLLESSPTVNLPSIVQGLPRGVMCATFVAYALAMIQGVIEGARERRW